MLFKSNHGTSVRELIIAQAAVLAGLAGSQVKEPADAINMLDKLIDKIPDATRIVESHLKTIANDPARPLGHDLEEIAWKVIELKRTGRVH